MEGTTASVVELREVVVSEVVLSEGDETGEEADSGSTDDDVGSDVGVFVPDASASDDPDDDSAGACTDESGV